VKSDANGGKDTARDVAQAFQPASSRDFPDPYPRHPHWRLESRQNQQARMSARQIELPQ